MGSRGLWSRRGSGSLPWSFGIRGGPIRQLATTLTIAITTITTIAITTTTIITIAIIAIIAIIRRFLLKRLHIIAYNRILITTIFQSSRSREIALILGLTTTMAV